MTTARTAYTTVKVIEAGVVLYQWHARRLAAAGQAVLDAFAAFSREAAPAVYTLRAAEGLLRVEPREPSRLFDGIPTRFAPTPLEPNEGAVAKPASPCRYDGVRLRGVSTLLVSADGEEIYEACSAAVVGWDGVRLLRVPSDRPRVSSTSEAALRDQLPTHEAALLRSDEVPLLLVNAVKGTCRIDLPGRPPFPEHVRESIDELLESTARRA